MAVSSSGIGGVNLPDIDGDSETDGGAGISGVATGSVNLAPTSGCGDDGTDGGVGIPL